MPTAGSMDSLMIFSGVLAATSSISMPPSVLAIITGREDGAVQQHGQVKLLLDVGRAGDEQFADQPAFGAGLFGDQHVAEHGLGVLEDLVGGLADFDAALEAALESALAAAAGMDLGFDGDERLRPRQAVPGDGLGRLGGVADSPAGWHAVSGPAIVWPGIRGGSFTSAL